MTDAAVNRLYDLVDDGTRKKVIRRGNDRYAGVRRLPDAPIAGESYRNAGSHYKVWQYNAAADTAHVENLTSGWVCTAHHPALYRLHDGSVELQWDYSTDGHFE